MIAVLAFQVLFYFGLHLQHSGTIFRVDKQNRVQDVVKQRAQG